jgi:hypothetical protein
MRRLVILFVFVAACSSGAKAAPPTTGSTPVSSVTVVTTTVTNTTTASTTTTVPPVASTAKVTTFKGPASVDCNAPTSVELNWTTTGAAKVELQIDAGPVFAHYPNGAQDQLEPLTCDGKSHTYTIVATDANGAATSKSLTISTKLPS